MDSGIDIKYVADLARLELSPEQEAKLQNELSSVVNYIAELAEVDVTGVEPTAHAAALTNVWREDAAKESFPRQDMLANAPGVIHEELIRVPRVLPSEEE
ncbi:MAG: Asp-tRNA(Asn)/Glu-tRNA(Gln) amidotransferase subunit GatC [Lentisphaerae bacterium]|nr:Asp-tRNA(Asn)/Glu-tRNA(Gln) amidotransferase subunit GatC [Lentisphaerota bacterium]MBQ9804262.1 Asp-tRNA(Asn)/Glu-tRNA(Gln) amidotransferase subunit GatC [Lentisphaeria bacterium]